jgi:oxygen-independent coproporphyrinogen-3 oxidase
MDLQLYLHFPFCVKKCAYCDFCSAAGRKEEMTAYATALEREIRIAAQVYGGARITTVFLGGGTPSIMPLPAMEGVWRALRDSFCFAPDAECTAEANPGTLTPEWLALGRRFGMNRLSLGVQASQDRLLNTLGRIHGFSDAREAVLLARGQGIANVNVDVMFGLPGQSLQDYLDTLAAVHALKPEHISAYSLILEPDTLLHAKVMRGEYALPTDDEAAEMYEQGRDWLMARGYGQYEISNFALKGYECRHNLGYWQGEWYLGLGLGAHSMLPVSDLQMHAVRTSEPIQAMPGCAMPVYFRRENTTDMDTYLSMMQIGQLPIASETSISTEDAMFETMMLGLRTTGGVKEQDFQTRHGKSLEQVYGKPLNAIAQEGLGFWREEKRGGRSFALTPKGLLLENSILMQLMK